MKLLLPVILALCLCQTGFSQRTVAAGASIAAAQSMGYRSPAVGGWLRGQAGPVRVIGEVDNSRKAWLDDGLSWRVVGTVDSPAWRGLSALAVGSWVQHRNSEYTKAGASIGGGLRWGPLYGWYALPDSSSNRTSAVVFGAETTRGRVYLGWEARRYRFDQSSARMGGWGVTGRLGWVLAR